MSNCIILFAVISNDFKLFLETISVVIEMAIEAVEEAQGAQVGLVRTAVREAPVAKEVPGGLEDPEDLGDLPRLEAPEQGDRPVTGSTGTIGIRTEARLTRTTRDKDRLQVGI